MKAKYIIFDFDGTLADSKAIFFNLYNEMATQKGYKLLDAENLLFLRNFTIAERCAYLGIPMYRLPFIAGSLFRKFYNSVPLLQFNPGMKELLAWLDSEGYTYYIASSNAKKNIRAFFDIQGLTAPEIFSSDRIFGKDRLLRKILKLKKLQPADVVYIGDEVRDSISCHECAIPFVWVSWGYDTAEAMAESPPDYSVYTPDALQKLIKELVSAQG